RRPAALPERRRQIELRRSPGRRRSEEDAGGHRDRQRESEHSPVEAGIDVGQEVRPRRDGEERGLAPHGDESPGRPSENREEDRLGDELPDETSASRSERETGADLRAPQRRSREKEVGQIGAGDEQDQRDDQKEAVDRAGEFVPVLPESPGPR